MKPASMVSQTINSTTTLTSLLSTTSSDIDVSSKNYIPLLLNNIESTGKAEIKNHEFVVAILSHTVKSSKNVHMDK